MAKIIQLKDETGADAYPVTGANMVDGLANVAKTGSYNDLSNQPTIPTVPVISTNVETDGASDAKTASPKAVKTFVEGKEYYTKPNTGIPASDIAAGVIPDTSGLENKTNKVTSLSSSSTDVQYPSAKCVHDAIQDVEDEVANKADKSEMSVSISGDQTTITLKSGTNATVINSHQSLSGKQDTLVSGTNIKTINGNSVLGNGNLSTLTPIVNHGTSDTTFAVTPNTLHTWGTVGGLTLTLATPTDNTIVNEYMIEFVSGSTATTLSMPSSVEWAESCGALSVEASKTYQISIVNNIGLWAAIANS